MNRRAADRVEEELRSGVAGARREPSTALRTKVLAAIESSMAKPALAPVVEPEGWQAWRRRLREASVAATVLFAVGIWIYAFSDGLGTGAENVASGPTPEGTESRITRWVGEEFSEPREANTAEVLAQLARSAPQTLTAAVDGSLLAELGNMAEDATRAARFLVGRVPTPLLARDPR